MKQLATITVIGRDKTGVIARITQFLFGTGANIEAMEEQVTRGQFSMVLQASWKSSQWHPGEMKSGLKSLGEDLGMEIRLRTAEPKGLQRAAIFVKIGRAHV